MSPRSSAVPRSDADGVDGPLKLDVALLLHGRRQGRFRGGPQAGDRRGEAPPVTRRRGDGEGCRGRPPCAPERDRGNRAVHGALRAMRVWGRSRSARAAWSRRSCSKADAREVASASRAQTYSTPARAVSAGQPTQGEQRDRVLDRRLDQRRIRSSCIVVRRVDPERGVIVDERVLAVAESLRVMEDGVPRPAGLVDGAHESAVPAPRRCR